MTPLAKLKIPKALQPGDRIAAVSPSAGVAGAVPARYEIGVKQLEETFGLQVVPMKHARKPIDWVRKNPKARADDLMEAFADKSIKGIITCIGGDDSIRLLEHLDLSVLRKNPKVFMGYSDTTALHFMCLKAGIRSYYGPAIMTQFAENTGMHDYTRDNVQKTLFSTQPIGNVPVAKEWTEQHLKWEVPDNQNIRRAMQKNPGPRVLQGKGTATGRAVAMCADLFPMIAGTPVWPTGEWWKGAVLFLETSEDRPPVSEFTYWLRNMGAQGMFKRLAGIVLARPKGFETTKDRQSYDTALLNVVRGEFNNKSLPLIAQADFGHTDPIFTIPYGAKVRLDCKTGGIRFLEASVR